MAVRDIYQDNLTDDEYSDLLLLRQGWTNELLLELLNRVSRPTTRENVDLDFDPDDYPLY